MRRICGGSDTGIASTARPPQSRAAPPPPEASKPAVKVGGKGLRRRDQSRPPDPCAMTRTVGRARDVLGMRRQSAQSSNSIARGRRGLSKSFPLRKDDPLSTAAQTSRSAGNPVGLVTHHSPGGDRRWSLTSDRRFLSARRRRWEPAVGFVGLRLRGGRSTASSISRSFSRQRRTFWG